MKHAAVIVGAGPAGLSAAYELTRQGLQPLVLEQADKVGGIARTEIHNGYRFDIGGHRFFTRDEGVQRLWREMLGADFLTVPRLSRISYDGRLLHYPLEFSNALSNLGVVESTRIVLSYLKARLRPYAEEATFDQWVTNRLGGRLYEIFFQPYTEKVWGIPCREIEADWAAQRIQGLSLRTALANALFGTGAVDTLIDEFQYPVLGPGMMWQRFREVVENQGAEVRLETKVKRLVVQHRRVDAAVARCNHKETEVAGENFVSSMPLDELIFAIEPAPPSDVLEAASSLRHRAFVLVGLIIDQPSLFPDNWIYVHNPDVRMGRIQNFKNWSAAMVPDQGKTSLGLEYFCNEGDDIWALPDAQLIDLASEELNQLGFAQPDEVVGGVVYRQPKAYPVYDRGYRDRLAVIRRYLETVENLQTVGRSGTHRYNNMDHSMLSGMAGARNLLLVRTDSQPRSS